MREPLHKNTDSCLAEFKNVQMIYSSLKQPTVALNNFDLQVYRNEVLVLMGPSGCGKTTVLNLLAGHEHPTSGTILFQKQPVTGPAPSRVVVFQNDAVFPFRSVEDNVLYSAEVARMQRLNKPIRVCIEAISLLPGMHRAIKSRLVGERERKHASDWISSVGLAEFRMALPRELSGGMRKRVEIARAFAVEPELLLLDEPFASLDALTREDMHLLLEQLISRTQCSLLIVTHDWVEAVTLADRIVFVSTRPGHVQSILPIDLPRPRDAGVRRSDCFVRLAEDVRELVRSAGCDAGDLLRNGL